MLGYIEDSETYEESQFLDDKTLIEAEFIL